MCSLPFLRGKNKSCIGMSTVLLWTLKKAAHHGPTRLEGSCTPVVFNKKTSVERGLTLNLETRHRFGLEGRSFKRPEFLAYANSCTDVQFLH